MGYITEHMIGRPNVSVFSSGQLLTQHILEPTRAERVFFIVLSSQKEFVDNVVI